MSKITIRNKKDIETIELHFDEKIQKYFINNKENVILIGEEELIKNEVKIKNMRTGNDKKVDYRLL